MAVAARRIIPAALSWRLVRQASGRLTWGVADQGMSTLTNFLLSIFVARTLGATQFGAFSLAYLTFGFALNASRGLSIEPLLIRFSGTDLPTWRRATAGSTGTALLVGLASGVCAFAAGLVVGGTTGLAFIALGLTLPGLLLQDSWRYSFFALGRGHHAFINDTIWAAVQIPSLLLLKMSGHANVFWFVLAWGGAASVGAVIGALQARVMPSLRDATQWLVRHRDLGPRYLAENTGGNAADTLRGYGVSYILGLAAVGYIQAANLLMGPFKIIFFGMGLITIPEAARLLRRSPRHLPLFCGAVSGGLTLLALAWGAALLVALPRGLGHLMLGSMWLPTYPLVLPATISIMAICATTGAGIGLHALAAARRSLRAVIISSVLVVAGALVGAKTAGTLGTMRYAAAGAWLGTLVCWWEFRRALHESGTVPVPGWLWPRWAGRHHRASPAKLALVTGVMAVLVAATGTAWILTYKQTGAHATTSAQAPASAQASTPASAPPSALVTVRALKPASASSFDPYGDGQGENSHLASLAIDASPATAWHTDWYTTTRFGNLKPGTGLLLDMGRKVNITEVRLWLGSAHGADLQLRAGDSTSSLRDLAPVARAANAGGQVALQLTRPVRARYVLIWFTKLPPDNSGTFQANIFNVRLEGSR